MQDRIKGVIGRLDWGYFTAAAINGYTVARTASGQWSLHATVVTSDAFKIRQRPLIFVAEYRAPKGDKHEGEVREWRWPVERIEHEPIVGTPSPIRVTLGELLP